MSFIKEIRVVELHSTKPKLRFCAGSYPAQNVPEIRDGEKLGQWSRLEVGKTPSVGQLYRKNNQRYHMHWLFWAVCHN